MMRLLNTHISEIDRYHPAFRASPVPVMYDAIPKIPAYTTKIRVLAGPRHDYC